MSTQKRKALNNNANQITWDPRHQPPSAIKRRILYKQHEISQNYPGEIVQLQHLETIPPPKNNHSMYNTYTYRFGMPLTNLQYNMLQSYPNPRYIAIADNMKEYASPMKATRKNNKTNKTNKNNKNNKNNKSKRTHNNLMKRMAAVSKTLKKN
jgi:hypothetical protein